MRTRSAAYEAGVVSILAIAFGIFSFEQTGISYLLPFIQHAWNLSNAQAGMLISAYWVGFAVSSSAMGGVVDAVGKRKRAVIVITALIAVGPAICAAAPSFAWLLAGRAVMGMIEGPMVQVSQTIVALESRPSRRGINAGIVGNLGGALLGMFVAPLVLVRIATRLDWHLGFLAVTLPGLIIALLAAMYLREPPLVTDGAATPQSHNVSRTLEVLQYRNVWLCGLLCCFFAAYLSLGFAFMPLFFTRVRHYSPDRMSALMSMLGLSAILYAVLVPALSDRIGRRPVMVAATLLSLCCPFVVIHYSGSALALSGILLLSWVMPSTGGLIMGAIPTETVPARSISTAIGLIVAFGVLLGGLAGPTVAGFAADSWGLPAALLIQAGCAGGAVIASACLRETAPRALRAATARAL